MYLRNEAPWKKFLSLFGGMTLAMLITFTGQSLLHESFGLKYEMSEQWAQISRDFQGDSLFQ